MKLRRCSVWKHETSHYLDFFVDKTKYNFLSTLMDETANFKWGEKKKSYLPKIDRSDAKLLFLELLFIGLIFCSKKKKRIFYEEIFSRQSLPNIGDFLMS